MKRRPLVFPVVVVLVSAVLVGAMLMDGSRGASLAGPPGVAHPSPRRTLSQLGVYTVSAPGRLAALDADTGVRRWSLDTGATIVGSPALANGALYVSMLIGADKAPVVYALDAGGGQVIWQRTLPFGTALSGPVVAAGKVWVATGSAQGGVSIVTLSEKDGAITPLALAGAGAPVLLAVSGGSIYVAAASTTSGATALYVVTPGSGQVRSPVLLRQAGMMTALAVTNGVAYVTADNAAAAYSLADGARLWQYAPSSTYTVRGAPLISGGTVYLVATDTAAAPAAWWLYAVSATNGQQRWRAALGQNAASAPTLANGTVYSATDGHTLYAVSASTGVVLRQVRVDASASMPPVYALGVLFAGAADGTVTALRTSGGSVLWTAGTETNLIGMAVG